jgi:restriction system protein
MGGYWSTAQHLALTTNLWLLKVLKDIKPSVLNDEDRKYLQTQEHFSTLGNEGREAADLESDELIDRLFEPASTASITLSGIVTPERKVPEGLLIKVASLAFAHILEEIEKDGQKIFEIPPDKWEEIVAGAYDQAGFDEVILTPRSGDHGRDVIAIRKGIGSIKIINSVKAYKPSHLVGYDDVRALLGVLSGERDASKGIMITTSNFPPKIMQDPYIAPFVPYRLELMNGVQLQDWLRTLSKS